MMVVFFGFLFGAKVQLSTAKTVARSIHLEHANLHNGSEFMVSNVDTIKNEGLDLIYIFDLIFGELDKTRPQQSSDKIL